jgi:hypothetical protein
MRESESLGDSPLERELQALVAVEPAPDFLARTRTRISQQRTKSRLSYAWIAGCVAAAAVVFGVFLAKPTQLVEAPILHSGRNIELPALSSNPATGASTPEVQKRSPGKPARARSSPAPATAVLVSAEDALALEELLQSVSERRFEVVVAAPVTRETDMATNISIPPILFEPVEISRMEGAFQ